MNPAAYFDNAATTPIDPRAAGAVVAALQAKAGNPSSLHRFGREARSRLEDAREKIAAGVGIHPRDIVFTASATEANNLAIFGLAERAPAARRRIVASPIEHPSVLAPLAELERRGFVVDRLPVRRDGRVDVDAGLELLDDDVAFSTLMQVNNETGAIQLIEPWAAACGDRGIPLHVDAVQGFGRIPAPVSDPVTSFAISSHKIHGPPGAAALIVRNGTAVTPRLFGGTQERDRRAGTENAPAIAGFAAAVEFALAERSTRSEAVRHLERLMLNDLDESMAVANVDGPHRVPGILSLRFTRLHGETLLMAFDLRNVAVSMGSACSSGAVEPSHVLRCMGLSSADCYASLRVSTTFMNTEADVVAFVAAAREITAAK